jgi:hypothetical protein
MPALSAFADLLDKAADLLMDPAVTSDELHERGLPGQRGAENKLLTRVRDQVVKRFGPNDDLRVDVEIFLRELSQPRRSDLSWGERTHWASQLRGQAECLREFAAARLKEAKKSRRLHQALMEARKRAGRKRPSNAPTFNLKTGVLTIGGNAYTATTSERHVLRVLVERQTATLSELQQAAGRPDRVLKGLLKKYRALRKSITLPGRAGHGGYSTTIEPARTSP